MATPYLIEDEPKPGGLSHLVVNPIWPFFAIMFAGAWLSWPWFAFNSVAQGDPRKGRITVTVVVGFLGKLALYFAIALGYELVGFSESLLPYAFVFLTIWNLAVTYALFEWQYASFALYEYYGGPTKNGVGLLILGALLNGKIMAFLPVLARVVLR